LGLTGQTAVVAGGARGIRRAIARAFAEEGANVAVIDRDVEAEASARELEHLRVHSLAVVADVTSYDAMKQAAARVAEGLGRIGHLVFAVGIGSGKYGFPFWNLEPSDWGRVLEVNVVGAVNFAHAFVPALIKACAGTVLFLSS